MLRSIAELAAYGTLAALLMGASLAPPTGTAASSATTVMDTAAQPATDKPATDKPGAVVTRERGALLFATKGCVGCHMHAALPNAHMQVGPSLSGLPDRAATRVAGLDARAYVRQSLREPQAFTVSGYGAQMPDLHLTDEEIESLTAFLLSPTP
jgi:mono/diheme cytochrome c family protein